VSDHGFSCDTGSFDSHSHCDVGSSHTTTHDVGSVHSATHHDPSPAYDPVPYVPVPVQYPETPVALRSDFETRTSTYITPAAARDALDRLTRSRPAPTAKPRSYEPWRESRIGQVIGWVAVAVVLLFGAVLMSLMLASCQIDRVCKSKDNKAVSFGEAAHPAYSCEAVDTRCVSGGQDIAVCTSPRFASTLLCFAGDGNRPWCETYVEPKPPVEHIGPEGH